MGWSRLADEYDAAQERGEVRAANERTTSSPEAVGVSDIGLTHKDIHEARQPRIAKAKYGRLTLFFCVAWSPVKLLKQFPATLDSRKARVERALGNLRAAVTK